MINSGLEAKLSLFFYALSLSPVNNRPCLGLYAMYPARPKSRGKSGMTRQNPRLALTQISPRARTDIISESVSLRALSVSREWKKCFR